MFCQLFGNYLVAQEVITKEEYRELIEKQLSARVKLGTIAVAEGMLTQEQVDTLHRMQMQYDKRFGDLAVENNMLTDEQVGALLKKQGDPYMKFLEVILASGKVSVSAVDEYLTAFQKEKGFNKEEMDALKNDDIDKLLPAFIFSSKPYVTELASLVLRNINRFVTRDFYFDAIRHVNKLDYKYLAVQKTVGDNLIYLGVSQCDEGDGFAQVASGFAEEKVSGGSVEAYDAVGEFINCNSGLFSSEMSKNGKNFDMEPAQAFENDSIEGQFYVLTVHIGEQEIKLVIGVEGELYLGKEPVKLSVDAEISEGQVVSEKGKGRILIVDDSRTSRKILRGLLESEGYVVLAEAQDGEEGVEMYKKYTPDLVTMDITMPKLDGIGALKQIKRINSTAKVVMITAAGQQSKIIEALKLGAEQFITKPFEKAEILKCLEKELAES